MPLDSRAHEIDPHVCPLCSQAFNLADLSDVPSPYNKLLTRFLDYATGRITCEQYLLFGQESDSEVDHESEYESKPFSQHMTAPTIEISHHNLAVTKAIFADIFEVFTHQDLHASLEYALLSFIDIQSISALSICWFVSPSLL